LTTTIAIPRNIAKKLRDRARDLGLTLDEYLVEIALQELDPPKRAIEYIEASKELIEDAKKELEKGDIRQAAEKVWGAAALAIKAYASWREGKRLTSHGELWHYSKRLMDELGDWVSDAWAQAASMHICFYEGWCTQKHVEEAMKRVEKLVKEVEKRLGRS